MLSACARKRCRITVVGTRGRVRCLLAGQTRPAHNLRAWEALTPGRHGPRGCTTDLRPLAAAKALIANTELPPKEIVQRALSIAADICVYTNQDLTVEVLK